MHYFIGAQNRTLTKAKVEGRYPDRIGRLHGISSKCYDLMCYYLGKDSDGEGDYRMKSAVLRSEERRVGKEG